MITHEVDHNSPEWDALRLGIPTGSGFKNVITAKGARSDSFLDYAETMAGELFAGQKLDAWEGNRYTDRGHEVEEEAVAYYEFHYGETFKAGFITDDAETYGCSPDRIQADRSVEVKCFPKLHIRALMYYAKHKKCPSSEKAQVQGQIHMCEKEYGALLYYHRDLPKLMIVVPRDQVFINKMLQQIKNVIEKRDEILQILQNM